MIYYKLQTKSNTESFTSYGIDVVENGVLIKSIDDVTTDKDALSKLIDKFNTYNLELCHLEQAVEDYLYDLCVD